MRGREGTTVRAAGLGALFGLAAIGLSYLGQRLAGLPFIPLDVFDWLARVLPGAIINFTIETMVMIIRALGIGPTWTVAKTAEQLMGMGLFVLAGAGLGAVLLITRGVFTPVFSADPAVRSALAAALLVAAVMQPLAGYVFVLDGVLIGAGDGRYLALAASVQLVAYLPLAAAVGALAPRGTPGLVWLWVAFAGGWMAVRGLFLGWRARGDRWLIIGASR